MPESKCAPTLMSLKHSAALNGPPSSICAILSSVKNVASLSPLVMLSRCSSVRAGTVKDSTYASSTTSADVTLTLHVMPRSSEVPVQQRSTLGTTPSQRVHCERYKRSAFCLCGRTQASCTTCRHLQALAGTCSDCAQNQTTPLAHAKWCKRATGSVARKRSYDAKDREAYTCSPQSARQPAQDRPRSATAAAVHRPPLAAHQRSPRHSYRLR